MKVFHLNILATKEDVKELNRVGWDGHPRFAMHADITGGDLKAAAAGFSEGAYKLVAKLSDDRSMDEAFRLTNHISEDWTTDPERSGMMVYTSEDLGNRSTSVGDVIEKDGKRFMVASFGFEELAI